MSAMAGIAALVDADALLRPDPAAPDRYAVFACPSGHRFMALALDGWFHESYGCHHRVSASAVCGAPATCVERPAGPDAPPVAVVVARRGREVEWIKRRAYR